MNLLLRSRISSVYDIYIRITGKDPIKLNWNKCFLLNDVDVNFISIGHMRSKFYILLSIFSKTNNVYNYCIEYFSLWVTLAFFNSGRALSTNASETVNSIHVQYKSNQLMDFVGKLKDEQQKEIERAVICRGKYRFKDEFSHLTVNETSWFKMSKEKRQ